MVIAILAVAIIVAGSQFILATPARADIIGDIQPTGSWKNQTNSASSVSPMNLTIGGNVQGKSLIVSAIVCAGVSDPTNLHFIDLIGSNTFLNGVSETNSTLHCSGVTAISTQGSATSKIRLIYSLSGVAQYSAISAISYANVSGFGSASGKVGISVASLSQNLTTTAKNSWSYGYVLNIAGCSAASGSPYPVLSQFPNPGVSFRRDGTNNDTIYGECESVGDSHGQLPILTKTYLNSSAFASPTNYLGLQSELLAKVTPSPISVVIGTIDVAGLFALMIFFCLLGIGIAGAWELRKRIA